jgi:outer membrane protein assembly factor BamB
VATARLVDEDFAMQHTFRTRAIVLLVALAALPCPARADNWPAWRGADGIGRCGERDLPVKWSAAENVRWKVKLPGPGNSTPVIWGERVFLTQATDKGRKRGLLCLSRKDGQELWRQAVTYDHEEPTHETNPYCSSSPATDGERVVVSHGSAGVYCYDFAGRELWHRDLGPCEHIWGNAASPVLYGDLILLNFGPGERTFLIALDRKTGADVWKVEEPGGKRGDKGQAEWVGSWSTPTLLRLKDHDELVMSWPGAVKAYAPKTGELLWTCKGLEKDGAPDRLVYTSPLVTPEVVVAMAGFGGPALAVKPGGKGDVTESHRLWRLTRAPQRIGSGVIAGDYVYVVNEPGTAECVELRTGKTVWNERVGAGAWGSLVHAGDKLYVTNLDGETLVLAAGPKFEVVSRNPLGERTRASIAVSDGNILIRTYEHLWCVGK